MCGENLGAVEDGTKTADIKSQELESTLNFIKECELVGSFNVCGNEILLRKLKMNYSYVYTCACSKSIIQMYYYYYTNSRMVVTTSFL